MLLPNLLRSCTYFGSCRHALGYLILGEMRRVSLKQVWYLLLVLFMAELETVFEINNTCINLLQLPNNSYKTWGLVEVNLFGWRKMFPVWEHFHDTWGLLGGEERKWTGLIKWVKTNKQKQIKKNNTLQVKQNMCTDWIDSRPIDCNRAQSPTENCLSNQESGSNHCWHFATCLLMFLYEHQQEWVPGTQ